MQRETLQRHGRKPLAVTMSRVCMVWLSLVEECCAPGRRCLHKSKGLAFWGHWHNHPQHIFQIKPAYTHMRLCVYAGSFVAVTLSANVHQTNLAYDPGLLRTLPGERSSCIEVLAMPLFGTPQDPNEYQDYTEYKPEAPSVSGRSNISSENDVPPNEKLVGTSQSPAQNDDSPKTTSLSGASSQSFATQSQAEAAYPSPEYEVLIACVGSQIATPACALVQAFV